MLYEKLKDGKVTCNLCAHLCTIPQGQFGMCGVRTNKEGTLYSLVYGSVIASHVDPIEKKPFYHFFPGSTAYSIATVGCNFKCSFCQNWQISQVGKRGAAIDGYAMTPEQIVEDALQTGCKNISYTYTEPTIFFEYAYDTARVAKEKGLYNTFVTNGYMTADALTVIKPYLDGANVDLKSFREDFYVSLCKGHLKPVLESIEHMKKEGIWVEVTTLLIPGQNDSVEELTQIAEFIASVGTDIPWHISRFRPEYTYTDSVPTPLASLRKAKEIGEAAGLRYVYMGNVLEDANTVCCSCNNVLIERTGFSITHYTLKENTCSLCGTVVDGVF
ncbi:MAG: AmmeMemoRadiSam system radical SAM enzyme [Candidatus Omnitrophica bacterium]|nr:AmmeMemoRadiSam system radical SAM enzyme [Candidatus Omnitrophota bacterium]